MFIQNLIVLIFLCIIALAGVFIFTGIDFSVIEHGPEIISSLMCLGITFYILFIATRCKGRLVMSLPISFVALYLIFIYVGAIAHFLYSSEIITLIPYVFQDYNYDLLIVANLSLITLALGVLAANYITRFQPQEEIENYYTREIRNDLPGFELNPVFISALLVCIVCGLISAFALPEIPLIYGFTHPGDVEGLMAIRNQFSSVKGIGALQFFYIRIFSLLTFLVVSMSMVSKTKFLKVLVFIVVPLFLFFISMSAHRTYILEYIFVFFIFLNYMGLKVNLKTSLILSIAILIIFGAFTASKMGIDFSNMEGYMYFGRLLALRFFVDQMLPLAFITENFPQQYNLLLGQSFITDMTVFLPGVQETLSMWISKELNPRIEEIGSAPTCVNGEFYANFWYPGIIIGMFLLGLIMQYVFIYFIRVKRTVSNVTLLTLINYSFCSLTIAGLLFGFFLRLIPVLIAFVVIKKLFDLVSSDISERS